MQDFKISSCLLTNLKMKQAVRLFVTKGNIYLFINRAKCFVIRSIFPFHITKGTCFINNLVVVTDKYYLAKFNSTFS